MRAAGVLATCCLVISTMVAADWPEWRGPHRDGILTGEPKSWPEKLNLKWKTEVGIGHASPIFAGGSIYVFARQGEKETALAIDPANGKVRWQQQYPAPYKMHPAATAHGEGPKSTPLYSNGRLYTFGITESLSCFNAETGKLLWRKDSAQSPDFGAAVSPILDNGLLIVHVGNTKTGALTAYDANTGNVKWTWDGDSPAYASPIVVELSGVRQVITQSRQNIIGVAAANGKLLWKIPFTTSYEQNIVTPVLYHDILIFSGLDKGVFAVRLSHSGDTWTPQTVWQTKDASMYMNSPVLIGDLLIGFSHLKRGQLFAVDPRTGAILWTGSPRSGDNAALLASASTLFSLNSEGQLLVARPSAKSLGEVRRYEVADSPTWAHPVVLEDGFLVKDLKTLARWSVN
ncbi:MAG TPA: PQQ-binding-like beta-propeller repeat protein [Bryobacteraceae bacterium]|nr:PQQ-binding-like beta-propeller repeat protein [Bryobacteraceae bacterium]